MYVRTREGGGAARVASRCGSTGIGGTFDAQCTAGNACPGPRRGDRDSSQAAGTSWHAPPLSGFVVGYSAANAQQSMPRAQRRRDVSELSRWHTDGDDAMVRRPRRPGRRPAHCRSVIDRNARQACAIEPVKASQARAGRARKRWTAPAEFRYYQIVPADAALRSLGGVPAAAWHRAELPPRRQSRRQRPNWPHEWPGR